MYVHFRKRFPADVIQQVNDAVANKIRKEHHPPEDPESSDPDKEDGGRDEPTANQGKLLVDATCASADISYPIDLKLLNKAREKSEEILDELHKARGPGHKKPRTYRRRARKQFLSAAKSKRLSMKKIRRCRRQQLGYLRRNLKSIGQLADQTQLTILDRRQYKNMVLQD